MTLVYHPEVQSDFNGALDYYVVAGVHVADRFEAEFRSAINEVKAGPRRFPFYLRSRLFRRARLKNFPYVVVYREYAGGVRVTVLKHERKRPEFGMKRR